MGMILERGTLRRALHRKCRVKRHYPAAFAARLVGENTINVKADNAAAVARYRRLGFEPIAEHEEVMLQAAEENSGKL